MVCFPLQKCPPSNKLFCLNNAQLCMNYIKTIRLVKSVRVVDGDHQNDYLYIFKCSVKLLRPLLMFVSLFHLRFRYFTTFSKRPILVVSLKYKNWKLYGIINVPVCQLSLPVDRTNLNYSSPSNNHHDLGRISLIFTYIWIFKMVKIKV